MQRKCWYCCHVCWLMLTAPVWEMLVTHLCSHRHAHTDTRTRVHSVNISNSLHSFRCRSFNVDSRDWHTNTFSLSLSLCLSLPLSLSIPPPSVFLSLSLSVSQTWSFCFSASLSLQRKPWPLFQTRPVAMENIFFEYYSLSLNDTCCVFVLVRRAFHSFKLPWEWFLSAVGGCRCRSHAPPVLLWAHAFSLQTQVFAGGAAGFIVWFSLMMHIPLLVYIGVGPVELFKQPFPIFYLTNARCSSEDCGLLEYFNMSSSAWGFADFLIYEISNTA